LRRIRKWIRAVDVEAVIFFVASAYILWRWSTWPS